MRLLKIDPKKILLFLVIFLFIFSIYFSIKLSIRAGGAIESSSSSSSSISNSSSSSSNSSSQGDILEGVTISNSDNQINGYSKNGYSIMIQNQNKINSTGVWNATQYSNGDIITSKYKVQLGDTLWQIAKAHYGDGNQWTKILNSNYSKIGLLLNHQKAKIIPGQILTLP